MDLFKNLMTLSLVLFLIGISGLGFLNYFSPANTKKSLFSYSLYFVGWRSSFILTSYAIINASLDNYYLVCFVSLLCISLYLLYILVRLDYITINLPWIIYLLFFSIALHFIVKYRFNVDTTVYCASDDDVVEFSASHKDKKLVVPVQRPGFVAAINRLSDSFTGVGALRVGAKVRSSLKARPPIVKVGTTLGVAAGGMITVSITKNILNLKTTNQLTNKVHGTPTRPNSPTNPFASSVLEKTEQGSNIFFDYLPHWMKEDIAMRVPSSTLYSSGEYNLLFTKYNLCVYLMVVSLFMIIFRLALIWLFSAMKNNHEFISTHFSKILGKFASSKWININILFLQLGVVMFILVVVQCVLFMYANFIPSELGAFCDEALSDSKS